jgi:hypothetical protein
MPPVRLLLSSPDISRDGSSAVVMEMIDQLHWCMTCGVVARSARSVSAVGRCLRSPVGLGMCRENDARGGACHDGEPRACASRAAARRHSAADGQADAKAIFTRRADFHQRADFQELQPDRAAGRGGELGMGEDRSGAARTAAPSVSVPGSGRQCRPSPPPPALASMFERRSLAAPADAGRRTRRAADSRSRYNNHERTAPPDGHGVDRRWCQGPERSRSERLS